MASFQAVRELNYKYSDKKSFVIKDYLVVYVYSVFQLHRGTIRISRALHFCSDEEYSHSDMLRCYQLRQAIRSFHGLILINLTIINILQKWIFYTKIVAIYWIVVFSCYFLKLRFWDHLIVVWLRIGPHSLLISDWTAAKMLSLYTW